MTEENKQEHDTQSNLDEAKELPNPFGNDFFKDLSTYEPEAIKDEVDFKPIKGRYNARISRIAHNIGISKTTQETYDFYSLDLQIIETIEGDKGDKRYLKKRYQNTPDGLKKLMNDLFTANIEFDKSNRENFDLGLPAMVDKTVKIRAWTWTPDKDMAGNTIPEDDREAKQSFVIVKDFSKKKSKTTSENIPF